MKTSEEKKTALIAAGIEFGGFTEYGIDRLYNEHIQPVLNMMILKAEVESSVLKYELSETTRAGFVLAAKVYSHPKGFDFKVLVDVSTVLFHKGQVIGESSDQRRLDWADNTAEVVTEQRFTLLEINGRRSSMDDFNNKL